MLQTPNITAPNGVYCEAEIKARQNLASESWLLSCDLVLPELILTRPGLECHIVGMSCPVTHRDQIYPHHHVHSLVKAHHISAHTFHHSSHCHEDHVDHG